MKKLILIVLFLTTALFSNSNTYAPDIKALGEDAKIYEGNFEIESECKPTCRILKSEFLSKVVDFNPFTGITKCIVTKKEILNNNQTNNEARFMEDKISTGNKSVTILTVEEERETLRKLQEDSLKISSMRDYMREYLEKDSKKESLVEDNSYVYERHQTNRNM